MKFKIEHVLQSGERLDSIEGYVVPAGHPVYEVIRRIMEKRESKSENENADEGQ